jgi:hypothetical protein
MIGETMLTLRSTALLVAVVLTGCGGAAQSDLLTPGGSDGGGGGHRDVERPDGSDQADVTEDHAADAPSDTTHMMDTNPPKDTAPPDTGPAHPPVYCGPSGTTCPVPGNECCVDTNTDPAAYECQATTSATSCSMMGRVPVFCDQTADCAPGFVCCGTKSSQYNYRVVACEKTCDSPYGFKIVFCNPSAVPDICASVGGGYTCQPSTLLPGYNICSNM